MKHKSRLIIIGGGGQHTAARIFAHIFGERNFFEAVLTSFKTEKIKRAIFVGVNGMVS